MTTLALLVLSSALAAPPGYTVSKSDTNGCTLYLGPADAQGVKSMRAECVWPDVKLDTFKAKMGDWAGHATMFSTVAESNVKKAGDKALVYQRHSTSGIADREIMIWMQHETVDGMERYSWKRADGESLTVKSGNVECPRSTGYWEAKAEGSGITVVHELSYDPGGRVPGFIVRWFQTSGLEATVAEARTALK